MRLKKHQILLIAIFALTVLFRAHYAFQTPNFDYSSYFNMRQTESIMNTGFPVYHDVLSYGGRTNIFLPAFHYIMAFFGMFIPSFFLFKIIPNIFAACTVFFVYLISYKLTKNINISLLTAFICSLVPIFITQTINSISVYSLIMPLTLFLLYSLMNSNRKRFIYFYIIIIILLTLMHSFAFLLIAGLIIYYLFLKLEHIEQGKSEFEIILFSILLIMWIDFLVFKNAFLAHGAALIWQNIPSSLLLQYFNETSLFEMILMIGAIPLVFGIYTIYNTVFITKDRNIYLLVSFALSVLIAIWFRLIEPPAGLLMLGILLTILASQSFKDLILYIKKTKFSGYKKFFIILFFAVFIIISVFPIFYFTGEAIRKAPSDKDIKALNWLRTNTDESAVIAASLDEGFIINEIAQRRTVFDPNFILIKNPGQIAEEITTIYTTPYKLEALRYINKHEIDYILFSDKAQMEFGINQIKYIDDEECFRLVYDDEVRIYKPLCRIEEI